MIFVAPKAQQIKEVSATLFSDAMKSEKLALF